MSFSKGKPSISIDDILMITDEANIASRYLNINNIPCVISSPLRQDNHPSLGIYTPNGTEVNYIDFSTHEGGRIFKLLSKIWNCSIEDTYLRIYSDFTSSSNKDVSIRTSNISIRKSSNEYTRIECKIREWQPHDISYWRSFGISLDWLKYAEVYPISHKIIT